MLLFSQTVDILDVNLVKAKWLARIKLALVPWQYSWTSRAATPLYWAKRIIRSSRRQNPPFLYPFTRCISKVHHSFATNFAKAQSSWKRAMCRRITLFQSIWKVILGKRVPLTTTKHSCFCKEYVFTGWDVARFFLAKSQTFTTNPLDRTVSHSRKVSYGFSSRLATRSCFISFWKTLLQSVREYPRYYLQDHAVHAMGK